MSDPNHPLNDPDSSSDWTEFFPGMFVRYGTHADRILRAACSSECAEQLWDDARTFDVGAGLTREAGRRAAVSWCMHCAWCGELLTGLGTCKVHAPEPCPELAVESTVMVMRTCHELAAMWPTDEPIPCVPEWMVEMFVPMAERELSGIRRLGPERIAVSLLKRFGPKRPPPGRSTEEPF